MSEISSIVNISMLEGVSRNMPFNTPNEHQSLKSVKPVDRITSEVYYNYNSKGERVIIHQVGNRVNITVI